MLWSALGTLRAVLEFRNPHALRLKKSALSRLKPNYVLSVQRVVASECTARFNFGSVRRGSYLEVLAL